MIWERLLFIFRLKQQSTLFTATFILLDWWARDTTIATKYTAIALFWFYYCFTICTLIEVLAGICGHYFFFLVAADRTSNDG